MNHPQKFFIKLYYGKIPLNEGEEMKILRKIILTGFVFLFTAAAVFPQEDVKKALEELQDLKKAPDTPIFRLLTDKFLSQVKEEQLKDSLLMMFISNPPNMIISPEYLPEYIPDNYTIYAPSEDSPAVPYLLGQYICHILYGKERYKQLEKNLLIKDNLNILIQLQNPLWFKPTPGKTNPLQNLVTEMNEQGVWLHDLSNFFAKVITGQSFDKPLWLIDKNDVKNEVAEIDKFWQGMTPEKTEGYALTVLNDLYDHESFKDMRYYPDDDPVNIINGLDTILAVILSKDVNDFSEFEIAYSEMFSNLEQPFREVILMNNWQYRLQKLAEDTLVKDSDFPKVIIHPQTEPVTEFDKRQKICSDYQKKLMPSEKGLIAQFVIPISYILSENKCSGVYYIFEIVKIEGNNAEAKVKDGPILVSTDLEKVKDILSGKAEEVKQEEKPPVQEPAFPPADDGKKQDKK